MAKAGGESVRAPLGSSGHCGQALQNPLPGGDAVRSAKAAQMNGGSSGRYPKYVSKYSTAARKTAVPTISLAEL